MADKPSGSGGSDTLWIVVIMLFSVVGLYYVFTGKTGTPSTTSTTTPKTTQKGQSDQTTNTQTNKGGAVQNPTESQYKDKIYMSISGAGQSNYNNEYARISMGYGAGDSVNITGWKIKSLKTGNTATIGNGVNLYRQTGNQTAPIILKSNDFAIVNTGLSPIGVNFRINKCSGYLSQDRFFAQAIPRTCPKPKEEEIPIANFDNQTKCYNYIQNLPSCRYQSDNTFPDADSPDPVQSECKNFIQTTLNYNYCISQNSSNTNFYSNEWRIYLGAHTSLWRSNSDNIVLLDQSGKVVTEVKY